ncbi:MAG: MFS transporter [Simkaniaceae bacterium]|nr:MFS transporter [Simkaniaceae bacterium]
MIKGCVCYGLAALFLFYIMALQVSPSIMTEVLMNDFSIQAGALGVMASVYFYSYTLMQIPSGILLDRWSLASLLSIACLICSGGALLFGYTDHVQIAGLGRFLMGFGSAIAFVGVLTVASLYFPHPYFAFFAGITQFLAALGAIGGELPLAYFVNIYGWRQMSISLGIGGIFLAILIAFVMKGKKTVHQTAQFSVSLKRIFQWKQNYWIALYAFTAWGPMAVFASLWGIPFVMSKYQLSNTDAAEAIMMMWLGLGVMSPFIGYLSDFARKRKIFLQLASVVGLFASLVALYCQISLIGLYIALLLMGMASGGQILCFPLIRENNSPAVASTAMGLTNMAVVAGGAILQPLAGYFLSCFEAVGDVYSVHAYEISLILVPLCSCFGLIISFLIKETECLPVVFD